MSRAFEDATARPRAALVGWVAVTLAMLAPVLLATATATDASGTVTLAVVMLALASLVVRFGHRSGAVASRGVAATCPTGDGPPSPVAGLVTDPRHHPLRPRAPGTA